MKRRAKTGVAPARMQREVPEEIVGDIMRSIRNQFCADLTDKAWFKDHYHFLRKNVAMWPARFMVGKGFSIPGARYREIMFEILGDVKRHGDTGKVRAWQHYLMACVQRHWRHHWEDYYAEAKSVRASVENALMGIGRAAQVAPVSAIEAIAAAHRVASPGRKVRPKAPSLKQLNLL